jgi:type IX secretion system PorP/SprF family membrane protein
MKKILLFTVACLLLGFVVKAQQLPQYTQYMFNDYVLNPAIGGTHDYYQVVTDYRYQWAGITDAPKTYMVSMYGPHKSQPMGWGGYIFSDKTGPTARTGVYGSYSYNMQIQGDLRVSAGVFLGLVNYKFDLSAIKFGNNDFDLQDPVLVENGDNYTKLVPDASFGVYVYSSQYYGGISMNQLLSNKITLTDTVTVDKAISKLKNHIYIHGGYKLNINRDFDFEASGLIKAVTQTPLQIDMSPRVIYQKIVWAGISARYSFKKFESVSLLMGYNYNNMISVGFSYDLTVSKISNYSNGTFEFLIAVKFNKIKTSGGGGGRGGRKLR